MDRRTALKNMSLTFGYAVAVPTVLSVLQSCKSDVASWTPSFLTETQGHMVTHLADIILPKTDIAGALDVNVPEFMDKMLNDIAPDNEKAVITAGADAFAKKFKEAYAKDAVKGTKEEYQKLLEEYFSISEEKQQSIFEMLRKDQSEISADKLDTYLIYKFLTSTRGYTLYGYYTSELVGETILNYDPIPGMYEPCMPLSDVKNGYAWSL
ncbi:gluconate 2-dehydrogenase subunit 3 family protein [Urechidicola croceus]|uniref:Gluconate 2-dehydrogenase subunit 3 family protein n=1 Tax=Urechidicola croceus TaxID=1850246 RepID=A0A1D8PAH8_9FLAO|nr:gluconate 2-dehydrogenase subunit 3 family protein [Urechidicola croceus]AOW21531.1 hypothetical protein LPB138_12955 [Urechidicola croceus]